ncbi:15511_t:CDS:2, partial [Cetraspora pellucida]
WTWPTNSEKIEFIAARALPEIGNWKECNSFTSGWALKENERKTKRQHVIRMTTHIKKLLEIMFHTGTANLSQKLTAQQMREELIHRAQAGEIEKDEIPNETTIKNWISGFSHHWKEAMALRALDETENFKPS